MKRIKVMLTAIAVLAVVGGALAFKAQKFGILKVCSGTVENDCPNYDIKLKTTTDENAPFVYYTTTTAENCSGVTNCTTFTRLTKE